MLLESHMVNVPAQREIDADLNEYGQMGNKVRASFGGAAGEAGCPDAGFQEPRETAIDTIANVLHWLDQNGVTSDGASVVRAALKNYEEERRA